MKILTAEKNAEVVGMGSCRGPPLEAIKTQLRTSCR